MLPFIAVICLSTLKTPDSRKLTSVPGSAQHQAQPRQALHTGGTEWVSAQPLLEHDEQGPKSSLDSLRASFNKYLLSNYYVLNTMQYFGSRTFVVNTERHHPQLPEAYRLEVS